MAYVPRSSFIPKETSGAIPLQVRKKRTVHVFSLLASFLLILALLSAVGAFFYKDMLEKRLEKAKADLNAVSSEDNESNIEAIRIYDTKLRIAHDLLNNHLAPSKVFEEIENTTKGTVRFSTLEYTYDPGFEAMLSLGGHTKEFSSIVLQKMQYLEDAIFSDFVIQGITSSDQSKTEDVLPAEQAEDSKVGFGVSGILKKSLFTYEGLSSESRVNQTVESQTFEIPAATVTSTSTSVSTSTSGSVQNIGTTSVSSINSSL